VRPLALILETPFVLVGRLGLRALHRDAEDAVLARARHGLRADDRFAFLDDVVALGALRSHVLGRRLPRLLFAPLKRDLAAARRAANDAVGAAAAERKSRKSKNRSHREAISLHDVSLERVSLRGMTAGASRAFSCAPPGEVPRSGDLTALMRFCSGLLIRSGRSYATAT